MSPRLGLAGATRTRPDKGGRRRSRLRPLLSVLLVLAGVAVLLYPVAATQYNNYKQREFSRAYRNQVVGANPVDLATDLTKARGYNESLSGVPILDPWLLKASSDPGSEAFRTYAQELNRLGAMARVRVPSVGIDLPVYHGTSEPILAKGVGHLYGTSLPVGGQGTHAVLTSHTGLSTATLFDHLIDVKEGDMIFLDVSGETLAYRVDQIKVVLPNQIDDLLPVKGRDYLTLFTCTPYAVNSHRLLVRAERIEYSAPVEQTGPITTLTEGFIVEWWMWALIGAAAFGVFTLAFLAARERTSRRKPRPFSALATDPEVHPLSLFNEE